MDGDVRLSRNDDDFSNLVSSAVVSRVEMCLDHRYGTIRGDGWTDLDASVICSQLGFSPLG